MFFKTSNPSALAAWQKYQQDCQKVKDEAKRLEAVLNVACRSVFVSGISGFCFKEGANKQVISSQADSLIKISRIWADFFPANTSNQPI